MKLIFSLVPAMSVLKIMRAEKPSKKSAAVSQLINISIYIEEKIVIFDFGVECDSFSFAIIAQNLILDRAAHFHF